ncbi:MAG: serine protease [Verrucomicrobiota bacterium]
MLSICSCSLAPGDFGADAKPPGSDVRRQVIQRVSAVVVTETGAVDRWVRSGFTGANAPKDADGGSATPISADGYFLTANHVLSHAVGKKIFVLYGRRGRFVSSRARIVWRSRTADIALLHAPLETPLFYEWTPANRWLAYGTKVIHGGISTGLRSPVGRITTAVPPDGTFARHHRFKIDIPLQPGDSGGPIVDANGQLVGLNSSVEYLVPMETPFFIESEGTRPDVSMIRGIIRADRARNNRGSGTGSKRS